MTQENYDIINKQLEKDGSYTLAMHFLDEFFSITVEKRKAYEIGYTRGFEEGYDHCKSTEPANPIAMISREKQFYSKFLKLCEGYNLKMVYDVNAGGLLFKKLRENIVYKDMKPYTWYSLEILKLKQDDDIKFLGYSKDWIDLDFNPDGIRECFINGQFGWTSAKWNGCHDCWDNIVDSNPTHVMLFPKNE